LQQLVDRAPTKPELFSNFRESQQQRGGLSTFIGDQGFLLAFKKSIGTMKSHMVRWRLDVKYQFKYTRTRGKLPGLAHAHLEVEVPNSSPERMLRGAKIPANSLGDAPHPPQAYDGRIPVDGGIRIGTWGGAEVLIVENLIRTWRPPDGELVASDHWKDDDDWSDEISPCLLEFTHLDTEKPEGILKFAQRWGLMGICRHGKPAGHHPNCRPRQKDKLSEGVRVLWEPLEDWRRLARQVRTILEVMSDMTLKNERTGKSQDWKTIVECSRPAWAAGIGDQSPMRAPDLCGPNEDWHLIIQTGEESHLMALGQCIENWLLYGDVHLRAYPQSERSSGLLRQMQTVTDVTGVLALQMANAATSRVGIYRCDDPKCRRPYEPTFRRPRAGESHYCPTCANGIHGRAANRKWSRNNYEPKGTTAAKRRQEGGSSG